MTFKLSADQHKAVQGIQDTLCNGDPDTHALAVLTGSAGTGKSTVVSEVMDAIRKNSDFVNIELGAATHRAASVLQDIIGSKVSTAHSLFKLKPGINRYGKQILEPSSVCDIPYGSIVILDEASMIGNAFLAAMVDIVKDKALKVLFVGDNYQLPPTKDTCSIFDGSLPTYTLTKVHRQKGDNPILDKAIEFRDFIKGELTTFPSIETSINSSGEGIQVLPHEEFTSKFIQKYMKYDTGAEVDTPLCTYTNNSAIDYNSMVRKAAYFLEGTIEPFYKGERLISNSIVKQGNNIILTNNEEVTVVSFQKHTSYGIPGYAVKVKGNFNSFTKTDAKVVFSPISTSAANIELNKLQKEAIATRSKSSWVEFYDLKNYLADLRPPFAGTTHKSQGGTFPSVFIDQLNINRCRDTTLKARLLYVALTRASNNVYINS